MTGFLDPHWTRNVQKSLVKGKLMTVPPATEFFQCFISSLEITLFAIVSKVDHQLFDWLKLRSIPQVFGHSPCLSEPRGLSPPGRTLAEGLWRSCSWTESVWAKQFRYTSVSSPGPAAFPSASRNPLRCSKARPQVSDPEKMEFELFLDVPRNS